jgi:hypothetical protein
MASGCGFSKKVPARHPSLTLKPWTNHSVMAGLTVKGDQTTNIPGFRNLLRAAPKAGGQRLIQNMPNG